MASRTRETQIAGASQIGEAASPLSYSVDLDLIRRQMPPRLLERAQWVCWKYVERDGKQTKCPINPTKGGAASSTDPATWSTFELAVAALRRCPGLDGVGFVFTAGDPFAGIDLDNCLDAATGEVKPWARTILDQFDSYSEISPSGKGVKVFIRGAKSGSRCKIGYEDGAVEMYDRDRFFTVTGQRLPGVPADMEERQTQCDAVYDLFFGSGRSTKRSPPPRADASNNGRVHLDDEIIRLATQSRRSGAKFAALWSGCWNDFFSSHSEADSSVVFTLAFYTKDAGQIDRIFRRSGLMRDKWNERHGQQTYGEMTIANALATVTEQYKARKPRSNATKSLGAVKSLSGEPQPGTVDPTTGRLILSTQRTLPTAECFIRQFHQHPGGLTLRHYAGLLLTWRGNRYIDIEDDAMRNRLLPWLHAAERMTFDPKANMRVAQDFPANPNTVKAALESIKAYAHLPATTSSPSWLDDRVDRPDPREIVPCRTSLLHLPAMTHIAPTPAFFNVNSLDYDHDPNAPEPTQWQVFLGQLFQDDLQAWDLLQEWFGYCLTGDTSQHKMLLIVGPRRSGKGTIARAYTPGRPEQRLWTDDGESGRTVRDPTTDQQVLGHRQRRPLRGKEHTYRRRTATVHLRRRYAHR